jgi:hypothetical protein
MGHVAWQPPILPIKFTLDAQFNVQATFEGNLISPLGDFELGSDGVSLTHGRPLRAEPSDVTQLIICRNEAAPRHCKGYRIGTGRKLRIVMDGNFVQDVEQNRIVINAVPGSMVTVTDDGPPHSTYVHGPARVDVEEFDFSATSNAVEVDLEQRQAGTKNDLAYDHMTGDLKLINGTRISKLVKYGEKKGGWFHDPGIRLDNRLPGENECSLTPRDDWKSSFTQKDLHADTIVSCVKSAEGDLGYLVIGRDRAAKPIAYHVYSYTWVR